MVYDIGDVLPIELDTPKRRLSDFNEEENEVGLRCAIYLIDETRDVSHI